MDSREKGLSKSNSIALGILMILVSSLCLLALFDVIGYMGTMISSFLLGFFGFMAYGLVIMIALGGLMLTLDKHITMNISNAMKYIGVFALGIIILHCVTSDTIISLGYGGYLKECFNSVNTAGGMFVGLVSYPFMIFLSPTWFIVILSIALAILSAYIIYPLFSNVAVSTTSTKQNNIRVATELVLVDFGDNNNEIKVGSSKVDNTLEYKFGDNMVDIVSTKDKSKTKSVKLPKDDQIDDNIKIEQEIILQDKEALERKNIISGLYKPESSSDIMAEIKSAQAVRKMEQESVGLTGDTNSYNGNVLRDIAKMNRNEDQAQEIVKNKFFDNDGKFVSPNYVNLADADDMDYFGVNKAESEIIIKDSFDEDRKSVDKNKDLFYNSESFIDMSNQANAVNDVVKLEPLRPLNTPIDNKESNISDQNILKKNNKQKDIGLEVNHINSVDSDCLIDDGLEEEFFDTSEKGYSNKESFDKMTTPFCTATNHTIDKLETKPEKSTMESLKTTRIPPSIGTFTSEKKKRADYMGIHKAQDYQPVTVTSPKEEPSIMSLMGGEELVNYTDLLDKVLVSNFKKRYRAPSDELLNDYLESSDSVDEDYSANKQKIVDFLEEFKIVANIVSYVKGPTFSRFELELARGTKASAILNQKEDFELRLGNARLLPLPGKNLIGVEMPNSSRGTVGLKQIINSKKFLTNKSALAFAIGKDIDGGIYIDDLAESPHILIGGTTGSGKSIAINVLIASLIYKYGPDDLRFIFIDPKKVELGIYDGIPHLLLPKAISDAKMCASALKWACSEMDRRLDLMSALKVRNLYEYNVISDKDLPRMPRIVIVVDEFADMMATSDALGSEIESAITRLASVARATGIHLVLATQRPVVKYVTGNIKANIPSRISFKVKNNLESRIILDESGAEALLGKGDMFIIGKNGQLLRLQGAFLDNKEVERVVNYVKANNKTVIDENVARNIITFKDNKSESVAASNGDYSEENNNSIGGGDSELFAKALRKAVELGQISSSKIQRFFSVGFNRAAKIIDDMEERGFVAGAQGARPREVLISMEEYLELYGDSD